MNYKWSILILAALFAFILPYVACGETEEPKQAVRVNEKISQEVAAKVQAKVAEQVQEQVRQEMMQNMAFQTQASTNAAPRDLERAFQWRITVFGFLWFTFVFVVGYFI